MLIYQVQILPDVFFLTQAQVNSAKGNKDTRLPHYLKVPAHWSEE